MEAHILLHVTFFAEWSWILLNHQPGSHREQLHVYRSGSHAESSACPLISPVRYHFFLRQRKHLSTSLSGLPLKISLIKIQQKSPLNLRSSGRAGAGARKPSAPQSTAAGLQRSTAPPVTRWAVGVRHSLGLGCRLFFLRPEDSAVCLQARGSRSSRTY